MKQVNDLSLNDDAQRPRASRWQWLRNAFAVDEPAEFEPTDEQKAMVDEVCRWMVRRGLTTAALIGIEMHRPTNYLVANIMHFFRPTVSACLPLLHLLPLARRALPDMARYRAFADMLEHRGAADYLTRRLEQIEAELASGAAPEAAAPAEPSGSATPENESQL